MVVNQASLNPRSAACVLGIMALLIVLASIIVELMVYLPEQRTIPPGLVQLFYLDEEQNIPTFFSTFLLLSASLLLGVITMLKKNERDSQASHWAILAFLFFLMATDEAAAVHEHLIMPMRALLGGDNFGVFYWAWVVPAIAFLLFLALFYVRFVLHLSARTRFTFLLAATLYIGGGLGVEMIGGCYAELHGRFNLTYSMLVTVEESLELAGIIVFIWALLVYIAGTYKEVQIRVCNTPPF